MEHLLTPPLYEEGDLVSFIGYKSRGFNYNGYKKKKDKELSEFGCPIEQEYNTFLVIQVIPAKKLFKKSVHENLSCKDNVYVVVSQKDGIGYFVYENELIFL